MNRSHHRALLALVASALATAPAGAQQNPLKLAPRPTGAAISAEDLRTRLYVFADDSMMGRQFGREGNRKGTDYIARELQRLGVEPGGENGTYFQSLPVVLRKFGEKSSLTVNGRRLAWGTDFLAVAGRVPPRAFTAADAIYGGVIGDTANQVTAEQAAGKLVVLGVPAGGQQPMGRGAFALTQRFAQAAAIAVVDLHTLSPSARRLLTDPPGSLASNRSGAPAPAETPVSLRITPDAAASIFGRPLSQVAPGTAGARVAGQLDYVEKAVPEYGRNVIGIIRGSDPALAGQYIAIGAHNDHVGFANPVDHDSARAHATAENLKRIDGANLRNITADERAAIRVNMDSLRALRPARIDSINNGADDDGSGSVAVLEIAEAIARMPQKPRRSILFVWHTGEEAGLLGAGHFVANPTVPRDSIVAQLNIDMIGRGGAGDLPGGGPDYLAVVGASKLSSELGRTVEAINARQPKPLALDYQFDTESTWPGYNNIYGRSDHAHYARAGIPIAFFFTGLHQDYHRVTDEPQYIDYPHMTRITRYIHELAVELANRDRRPAVDRPNT